jgi:superfamily II DNA or RNA helicase
VSSADYDQFIAGKLREVESVGLKRLPKLDPRLFEFQRDLVGWALKRGRAAIFADTGLGKTWMELLWAKHAGRKTLILTPLAVAAQTKAAADYLGIHARVCREGDEVSAGVNITNYDRLHKFDPSVFDAVALDESSVIKHHDAKTLGILMDAFGQTPMKLCATATPSPNDYTELGTHAEFLGVCTRAEMLSEFFCHDGGETQVWRLKGHARAEFWRWVAQWGALVRRPSDLGYDDNGYDLPPFRSHHHTIAASAETTRALGLLFAAPAADLMERRNARKASVGQRVTECAARVNADDKPWIVWCDLNSESDALAAAIPDAVEVRGSQTVEEKERLLADFAAGRARVLISKPSICGFGLNWQHCSRMAFVGVTDSYEAYYQAVRRIWRFGQTRECEIHIYASEVEGSVIANLERKATDAALMADELSRETRAAMRAAVTGSIRSTNTYAPRRIVIPEWVQSNPEAP